MKKLIFTEFTSTLLLLILITNNLLYSQDIIFFQNGDELNAKVLEIGTNEIKYKRFDNLEGPVFTINKSDVFMIKYKNGTKDVFTNVNKNTNSEKNEESVMATYADGQQDAIKYYKNYTSAQTVTGCTTIGLGGILGLIPAIATSTSTPTIENLGVPDQKLMNNSEYYMGYTSMAKKIKSRKVWSVYGVSIVINVSFFILLIAAT